MSIPKAFIKDIAIPISKDYEFDNSPLSFPTHIRRGFITRIRRACSLKTLRRRIARRKANYHKNKSYIGRIKITQKFLNFLKSGNKRGVFLVTGYRGMGKTSFVNKVLSSYTEPKNKIKKQLYWLIGKRPGVSVIHITIAQKQPKELDILRLMLTRIYEECKKYSLRHWLRRKSLFLLKSSLFLLAVTTLYFFIDKQLDATVSKQLSDYLTIAPLTTSTKLDYLNQLIIPLNVMWMLGLLSILLFIISAVAVLLIKESAPLLLIENIFKRCYASSSHERTTEHEMGLPQLFPKLAFSDRQTISHPIASNKEIEMALLNFLELIDNEFIFVFDELDKIEGAPFPYQGESDISQLQTNITYHEQIRERKQAIIDIIGGLKSFLTTANARFIFIAGREMFDATLADIADRQSALGSMFNFVFYVESFLKEDFDNKQNNSSVSISIEAYLRHVLYNDISGDEEDGQPNLYSLTKQRLDAAGMCNDEIRKTLICLQEFVIYLTYRSNGSPQKIIKAVHEFIKEVKKVPHRSFFTKLFFFMDSIPILKNKVPSLKVRIRFLQRKLGITLMRTDNGSDMETIYAQINPKSNKYLYFNFNDQYRMGFINYLYRPFLIEYGHNFKHYSDSIVASTSYLFDHLLKFHNFAFSISHLEMIPEVLSANKTPLLRIHIKKIVEYLSNKHVRETEIGLFEYKFVSRTLNEITFLSKTFESEAAAFNFTLDESHSIKLHVINKLNALRNALQKFPNGYNNGDNQIFSINYLQTMLGDLYFFDQEYDDAVIAYADAIKPVSKKEIAEINARDFLTIIKTKLKLGLAFEKIHSYDDAIPFYSDAVQNVKQFFHHQLKCKQEAMAGDAGQTDECIAARPEILFDILQVVNQCFLANIVIQEKLGLEGISIQNLNTVLHDFYFLSENMSNHYGENTLIDANVLLVAANLLYFKNNDRKWENEIVVNTMLKVNKLLQSIHSGKVSLSSEGRVGVEWRTLYLYSAGLQKVILGCGISIENSSVSIVSNLLNSFNGNNIWENQFLTKNSYKYIGIFLSNIGDSLLSNLKAPGQNSMKFKLSDIFDKDEISIQVNEIKSYFDQRQDKINASDDENGNDQLINFPKEAFLKSLKTNENCNDEYTISNVLRCYFLSGHSFMKRGRKFSTSFQHRKILYVLRLILGDESTDNIEPETVNDFLYLIEHTIKRPIVLIAGQSNGHTDRHMINKFTSILPGMPKADMEKYLEKHISYHPEIKEAEILFNYIKIQIGQKDEATCHDLVNNYNSLGTQYIRILELDLFVRLYQNKLKDANKNLHALHQINDIKEIQKRKQECVLIYTEYLYCMLTILRSMDLYETDYMLGHSYRAYTHFRIAKFLSSQDKDIIEAARKQIRTISEFKGSHTINDNMYHFSMAKKYYVKALQLHTEGTEYRFTIEDMIYLEDDINDNAYHFGAAMERYLLGNRTVKKYIQICNQYLKRPE